MQEKAGLDMVRGDVGDMDELGILESFKLKEHVLMAGWFFDLLYGIA